MLINFHNNTAKPDIQSVKESLLLNQNSIAKREACAVLASRMQLLFADMKFGKFVLDLDKADILVASAMHCKMDFKEVEEIMEDNSMYVFQRYNFPTFNEFTQRNLSILQII